MKKLLSSLLFILITYHSILFSSESLEENMYANIYADILIDEFDGQLDTNFHSGILDTELYSRILAAREWIEHTGNVLPYKHGNILKIKNTNAYKQVVNKINSSAQIIHLDKLKIYDLKSVKPPAIFPSSTRDGNLTGNTYPANSWSLSFDDGPRGISTKTVVDNLMLHNISASFFMLTREAKKYPDSVDYVLHHGHELALHSYNHKDLNKADQKTIEYEITKAKVELEIITDKHIELFRLPYGSGMRNKSLRDIITKNSLIHVFWNVDTLDWKDKNPDSIYKRTITQMNNTPNQSGIILFHDIHPQTVIASEMIMSYLKNNQKFVCTIGDMVQYLNSLSSTDCLK